MKDPLKTIESLHELKLGQNEKSEMFSRITQHIDNTLKKPIVSPFNIWSFIHHHSVYATSFALLLILAGGSAAAETALPGDLLYSVKRNFNEGVMQIIAFDAESKAKVQIQLVERRFEEAETVIATNPENETTLTALATDIQEHATVALSHIENVQNDSVVDAVELSNDLGTTLAAHDTYIDSVTGETNTENANLMMMATDSVAEPATMSFSAKMAVSVETAPQVPDLQSIIEDTKAQVELNSQNLTSIVAGAETDLVTKEKINDDTRYIKEILKDENITAEAKEQVESLIAAAEENASRDDLNTAFIILKEAEKIGESNLKSEALEEALDIDAVTLTATTTATSTLPQVE